MIATNPIVYELHNITGMSLAQEIVEFINTNVPQPEEFFKYEPRLVTFPTGDRFISFLDEQEQRLAVLRLTKQQYLTVLSITDGEKLVSICRDGVFTSGLRCLKESDVREAFPTLEKDSKAQDVIYLFLFGELASQVEATVRIDLCKDGAKF